VRSFSMREPVIWALLVRTDESNIILAYGMPLSVWFPMADELRSSKVV